MNTDVPSEFQETQAGLCEILEVSPQTMNNWIARGDKTGFPEHVNQLGRYKFYDIREVRAWMELWTKATKNMGPENRKKNNA